MIAHNPITDVDLPTPHQNELLTHLNQEAGEVIQEACKAQSYGFESRNPHNPALNNKEHLEHEIADFVAVVQMLSKTGAIDLAAIERLVPQKIEKKKRWLIQPVDAFPSSITEQKNTP